MTIRSPETLLLTRAWIAARIPATAYVDAVDDAFRRLAGGDGQVPPVGHLPGNGGAVHIKSAAMGSFAAIKVNANFPSNAARHGLPTIQGFVALMDLEAGRVLALMDSTEVTAQRTAAATAVAARYLANPGADVLALIGCGAQARYHLDTLAAFFPFRSLRCHDIDPQRSRDLAVLADRRGWNAQVCASPADAARGASIVVTCTPSRVPIVHADDVDAGAFVAAVGADSVDKNELHPSLMGKAKVVTDLTVQSQAFGDLRHAMAAGAMTVDDVYGELAALASGTLTGRRDPYDVFVFDSTGVAIEDLAAARLIYAHALEDPNAPRVALGESSP